MIGLAIAIGLATGQGFLHWRTARALRVLVIDGEMPADLLQERLQDAYDRASPEHHPDGLFIFSRDWEDELAQQFPALGVLQPLNFEEGQNFIYLLCDLLKPDVIIFDNVQSLLAGTMRDEEPWNDTLSLVDGLTRRRVAQVWLDHTGHNTARQYGSATKAWRFDLVGIMTTLPAEDRQGEAVAFKLSFDPPHGKARRRKPDNREQFAAQIIRLRDGRWEAAAVPDDAANGGGQGPGRRPAKVKAKRRVEPKPYAQAFHKTLRDALVITEGQPPGRTTRPVWEAECIRRGLLDEGRENETATQRRNRRAKFRTAIADLVAVGWIGVDGENVSDLSQSYTGSGGT